MAYKEFTTFPRKFDHGKVFLQCLKLGNMHAKTRIVIELYDVTDMREDSSGSVSLWRLTKKNSRLFVLEVRSTMSHAALVE